MKNKLTTILLVLILVGGVGVMSYPMISNMLRDRKQDEILTEYNEELANKPDEEIEEARRAAIEYNDSLADTIIISDPFDPDAAKPADKNYLQTLNLEKNGIMAYVEVPRLDIYEPVYHGTSDAVLAKGVGHLEGTSLPVGGVGTHSVMSGHTGLPDAEIFTKLESVKEGDIFLIHVLNEDLAYKVDQIKVVEPADTDDLKMDPEKDYVTLVTCTPYGINSHRLLVRGVRTEYTEEVQSAADQQREEGADGENWKRIYGKAIVQGLLIALLIVLVIFISSRFLKRNDRRDSDRKKRKTEDFSGTKGSDHRRKR